MFGHRPLIKTAPHMLVLPGLFFNYLNRVAGDYCGIVGAGANAGVFTVGADRIYCFPFLVLKTESFDRISTRVSTAGAGNIQLGIYLNNINKPGALLLDAGAVDISTTGVKELVINLQLTPGLYWLSLLPNVIATLYGSTAGVNLLGLSFPNNGLGGSIIGYYTTQAYGALPNPHPAVGQHTGSAYPHLSLRRA